MRRVVALLVLLSGCIAYILLLGTALRSSLGREQVQLWSGYYAVLVDADRSVGEVERALHGAGLTRTLSGESAQVEFHSFDEMQRVSVAELEGRLDPIDPRLDPYMRRVSELFRAFAGEKQFEVIYIRSDQPPLIVLPRIARSLGLWGSGARFPSWDPLGAAASLSVFCLFAAVVISRTRKQRIVATAGALPWLLTAVIGGLSSLPVVLSIYFAWAYAAEVVVPAYRELLRAPRPRLDAGTLMWRVSLFVFAATVGIGLTGFTPGSVNAAPAAAATVALLFAAAAAEAVGDLLKEHRVFTPVSIMRRDIFHSGRGGRSAYRAALPWLMSIALLSPLVALLVPNDSVPIVPQPQRSAGISSLSPDSLRRLWTQESGGEFPTMADYVAHRAYQTSYLYGPEYRLPPLGSHVTISRFSTEGTRMSKRDETVMEFDTEWYTRVTEVTGEVSVAGLLSNGGRPGGVVRGRAHRLYWQPLSVLRRFVLVLIVFVPVLVTHGILRAALRRTAFNQLARRRRQAA